MENEHKRVMRGLDRLGVSADRGADVRARQQDMLKRLRATPIDRGLLAGFDDCSARHCGRLRCAEVCKWGSWHRHLTETAGAYALMSTLPGPYYEVRIGRGVWAEPIGQLIQASTPNAKKLVRRSLDQIYNEDIVAVGSFQAGLSRYEGNGLWRSEIRLVVAGAEKDDLEKSFTPIRCVTPVHNILRVREIRSAALAQTIFDVLRRELGYWDFDWYDAAAAGTRPKKRFRTEFYKWELGLARNARLFRYGCDEYFNKLAKNRRVVRPKARKGHPYPVWLEPYQFGGDVRYHNDYPTLSVKKPRPKKALLTLDEYFQRRDDIRPRRTARRRG